MLLRAAWLSQKRSHVGSDRRGIENRQTLQRAGFGSISSRQWAAGQHVQRFHRYSFRIQAPRLQDHRSPPALSTNHAPRLAGHYSLMRQQEVGTSAGSKYQTKQPFSYRSIFLRQQQRGHGSIRFGDDPELFAVCYRIAAHQPEAILQA
jgi:hypothetical protein